MCLKIEVAAWEPTRSGFRLFYRIMRPADRSSIALVETGMVCFDYETGKIQPLPDAVRAICLQIGSITSYVSRSV